MHEILHEFPIATTPDRVFAAVSTPSGLDQWWTSRSSGEAREGAEFQLWFGPEYDWRARVTQCLPGEAFQLTMTRADGDWTGTRVGFRLAGQAPGITLVRFYHTGWPEVNEHFRVSSFCWAMYLRILRRHLEFGESVPYDRRLEV
jgi:uncharacterized protein YndB with AHSA1/START domain